METKEKRIFYKESFELCYLRHKYLKSITHVATRSEMDPYNAIIENFATSTFNVYKSLFIMVGLDWEDVMSTSKIYLATYIGLFALERKAKKLAKFKKLFKKLNQRKCEKEDILNKNKADFTCFLKQRLQDLVRVCKQKAKNIKGLVAEEFLVFTGTKQPPLDIEDLLENHSAYDYHPLNSGVFKTVKKNFKNQEGPVYRYKKKWYVCVPIRKKALSTNDITNSDMDPSNNIWSLNPEQFLDYKETNTEEWLFKKSSKKTKVKIVKEFFDKNWNNPELREEVKIAKEYLENAGE